MNKFLFPTCFLILALGVPAQESFHWKNLKFGLTTVQDTISSFGTPRKNEVEKARFDNSVPTNISSGMKFRKLSYKNIESYEKVYLLFLNEKLISVELTPKKKNHLASVLGKEFDAEFLFMEGIAKQMKIADYEGQKETTVPKVYPANYFMLAVKPDFAIIATVDNNSWKAVWRDALKKPTIEMYPGFVRTIQIFSRNYQGK